MAQTDTPPAPRVYLVRDLDARARMRALLEEHGRTQGGPDRPSQLPGWTRRLSLEAELHRTCEQVQRANQLAFTLTGELDDRTAALSKARARIVVLEKKLAAASKTRSTAKAEAAFSASQVAIGARAADREAFTQLAKTIDSEAATQPKDVSAAMRLCARELHRLITARYRQPAQTRESRKP